MHTPSSRFACRRRVVLSWYAGCAWAGSGEGRLRANRREADRERKGLVTFIFPAHGWVNLDPVAGSKKVVTLTEHQ
jgi:hypothetical protein